MSRIDRYLEELNGPQREAVLENGRPLLVLAGAGSGKTRVITTKIAYAIDVLGLKPWEILAVTFTNRAAKEMKDRVGRMLGDMDLSEMHVRTFHSFGAWLLRRYGSSIGLDSSFSIYDDEDSLSLLASCFPGSKKTELSPVAKAISLAKDMGLSPESPDLADFRKDASFARQFEAYEKRLRQVGNVDFADLIGRSIELLERDTRVATMIRRRFRMILVDEYQDSNISQFTLLKSLVGPGTFICVVGDDDQSIYRFRGAEVENILSFPDVYPNTRIVKLEQNYRSSKRILAVAANVISHNTGRHPKTLWTEKADGQPCTLVYLSDERNEALRVAMELRKSGSYDDAAVLYRTNAQSVAFETLFTQSGIPYKVIGALRFYDREEVKDALALLSLVMNHNDEVNFKRMVNKPARGIGDVSVDRVTDLAFRRNISLVDALEVAVQEGVLTGKAAAGASRFAALFGEAARRLEVDNAEALQFLLEESGLIAYYRDQDERNKTDKTENLGTLVTTVSEYPAGREGLGMFLESLMLDPTTIGHKDPSDKPGVSLITMHNTKGLEFDRVFITGLEEGLFPGKASESDADIEEERRIFYVAITRARKQLFLFSCNRRTMWGKSNYQIPSRFLAEIPKDLLEIEGLPVGSTSPYGGQSMLEERRMRQDSYGGALRKGMGRNANIILDPVRQFSSNGSKRPSQGPKGSFELGDRVYHDIFGEGEVQGVRTVRGKEMVDVRFSTGKVTTFFSENVVLEKLARD
ncbi:MAG: UvrD-helicase domain-containing protein [Sphaerochaetaceae bacterium]